MPNTVIVHGPQACGKTWNAEALRVAFGCVRVVDDWLTGDPIQSGALHLTYEKPSEFDLDHAMVISFALAIEWCAADA